MNHHAEAWDHVRKHLFGNVVEVTRETPWGFKEDRADIKNMSVHDFLNSEVQTDTIILHILSGEGHNRIDIEMCIRKAMDDCIKLVILEHNPKNMKVPDIQYIKDMLPEHITEDWGRNMLFACTTFKRLILNELSDEYRAKHLDTVYVTEEDEGIDPKRLIYTHTSEHADKFEIPKGVVWWVIGGGLAYEMMEEKNRNILIDSVLRQVLHCAYRYGEEYWKLHRIWDKVADVEYVGDYKQWRRVDRNEVLPDEIRHLALQDLNCEGDTVYVSTVHRDFWKHLEKHNNIMDGWTIRDRVQLKVV